MGKFASKKVFIFLGALVAFNVVAWAVIFDLTKSQLLEVNFFDVGQGDAIFIETPKNQQVLIDGGPGTKILEKLGKEMPFWDRDIDLIILSHPEADHLLGLIEVLKKYKVENILWTGVIRDTPEYKEWEELIKKEGAKIFIASNGQKIKMTNGISIDILFPFESVEGKEFRNSNDTSIVSRLVLGYNSFLFTGDISETAEKELISEYSCANSCGFAVLDSDVLKIAHHGSKTSSSEDFLKEVSPEIAVISVGKDNSYGHPTQEVLENLNKYGIKVLRTDEAGDIKIISDGQNLKIE
jgi:competence protein ComEC